MYYHQKVWDPPTKKENIFVCKTLQLFQNFTGVKASKYIFTIVGWEIVENIANIFESDLVSESIDKSIILSDLDEKIGIINDNGKIIFNRWLELI